MLTGNEQAAARLDIVEQRLSTIREQVDGLRADSEVLAERLGGKTGDGSHLSN